MKPWMTPATVVALALAAAGAAQAATPYGVVPPLRSTVKPPPPPKPPERFKPFRGTHVDSDRGGVDAYPKPKKPKGYISPY